MNAGIVRQLRMECCSHHASLPHDDGIVAFGCQDLDLGADARNLWSANEDHLDGGVVEFSFADRAVDLASIGIAANIDVERAQPGLAWILHFLCQQYGTGAGSEGRLK